MSGVGGVWEGNSIPPNKPFPVAYPVFTVRNQTARMCVCVPEHREAHNRVVRRGDCAWARPRGARRGFAASDCTLVSLAQVMPWARRRITG